MPPRPAPFDHLLSHAAGLAMGPFAPTGRDLLRVGARRWFLQAGLAGVAGVGLAPLLERRAAAATAAANKKAVIVFWLSGGPSHIDTWDPKPFAPAEIRGPYQTIATRVPGIEVCEHLPMQARIADKLAFLRSVDCSASNHTPITMQAGNALARRTDDGKDGGGYPSMGSVVAKFRGSNRPPLPACVGLADSWEADVWGAGSLGHEFAPVEGGKLADKLALAAGMSVDRLQDRESLRREFDRLSRSLDRAASVRRSDAAIDQVDRYQDMALDLVTSGEVQQAFDISQETDAMRDAYGRVSVGEKALLARRLVEAGVPYVLVSGRWGYFDHHGDDVPPWGGIQKGLTPILPTIDRALATLVSDLDARGLLDSTLILMMGEFGRTPVMSADRGRGHWTNCMSMVVAGGGLRMGQAIGATDSRGYDIKDARVRPADLAATVFRHLDIALDTHWTDPQGRPVPIVTEGGRPIPELG